MHVFCVCLCAFILNLRRNMMYVMLMAYHEHVSFWPNQRTRHAHQRLFMIFRVPFTKSIPIPYIKTNMYKRMQAKHT